MNSLKLIKGQEAWGADLLRSRWWRQHRSAALPVPGRALRLRRRRRRRRAVAIRRAAPRPPSPPKCSLGLGGLDELV